MRYNLRTHSPEQYKCAHIRQYETLWYAATKHFYVSSKDTSIYRRQASIRSVAEKITYEEVRTDRDLKKDVITTVSSRVED